MPIGNTNYEILDDDRLVGDAVFYKDGQLQTGNGSPVSGAADPYAITAPARSKILTRGHSSQFAAGTANTTAPGSTTHIRVASLRPFTKVRLILPNFEPSALVGCSAAVASSANDASKINPTGAWAPVTVNGSPTFDLPARISSWQPSYTFTDWITLASIARNDGGSYPLCHARLFIPSSNATMTTTQGSTYFDAGFDAVSSGQLFWQTRQAVDGVSVPANFTQTAEATTVTFCQIQFATDSACVSIAAFGDSLTEGYKGTICQNNWGFKAVSALAGYGHNVAIYNGGYVGNTTDRFYTRMMALLPNLKPQICIYSPFSPNDGIPTVPIIAAQTVLMNSFLQYCWASGHVPILTTPLPNINFDATADNLRKGLRDTILALGTNGVCVVCDFDAAVSDGATPARYASGMGNADGVHLSDAGGDACKVPMIAAIKSALQRIT